VRNAIHVWELAREHGAEVMLRIEDHDRERCRPEYEAGILDDLDWLGFRPDIYQTDAFRAGPCLGRQSDRHHIYLEAFEKLRDLGLVYACDCTRSMVASVSSGRRELRYSNRCRSRQLPLTEGYGWRVRIDHGVEQFADLLLGAQRQNPSEQCGDLLIRDRRGNWTYQFAVTVDDLDQGIDLVVRGLDLLPSTGRQIRLARLLGRSTPAQYAHHSLIMKTPTQKLSKSDGDTGVRELRARGCTRKDVLRLTVAGR
jgi:glutamyl-tRNA synthetase/glutamyl-Q tRNA(Asp) synthetase